MALARDPATYGGRGGKAFDDGKANVNIVGVRTVRIRSGNQVDSIQADYVLADGSIWSAPQHGGNGGSGYSFTLANDEYISKVEGKTNSYIVDQLTFHVTNGAGATKKYGPYGKTGRTAFQKSGKIVAFHGGAGDLLDRIGFYDLEDFARIVQKSGSNGGKGGNAFDDYAEKTDIVGIKSVSMRFGNQIDSIQTTYRLSNGATWTSGRHGGGGGSGASFSLADGEYISKVEGKTNGTLVDQLTFTITSDSGSTRKAGPYGKTGQTPFSVEGNIVAFYGGAGNLLDKIGFYYHAALSKSERFGGGGGSAFNDDPNTIVGGGYGAGNKISKLLLRSGNQVDSIQAEYITLGGEVITGPRFGGGGGSPIVADVGRDEVIVKMEGKTNGKLVDQLTFTVKNTAGKTRTLGPFGKTGQTAFGVTAENGIHGFFGQAGNLLDGIGAYYN